MKFTAAHSTIRWMVMVVPALLISAFVAGLAGGLAPVSAQACSWTGQWNTGDGIIPFVQTGNQVSGKGIHEYYKGTVSGNILTGNWSENPDGSGDHGALQITMDPSCNSFTGGTGINLSTTFDPARSEPFNGTRVGGTPTTTPPPPTTNGGQQQRLGGINWMLYCESQGYAGASLDGGTINDWHCYDSAGKKVGIDPGAACQWQDGTNVAKWDTFNDPFSWGCFGTLSASTFSIWTAEDSGAFQQVFNLGETFRLYARLPQATCVSVYEFKSGEGKGGWITQNSCNNAGDVYWRRSMSQPAGWRHFYLEWQDSSGTWQSTDTWAYAS